MIVPGMVSESYSGLSVHTQYAFIPIYMHIYGSITTLLYITIQVLSWKIIQLHKYAATLFYEYITASTGFSKYILLYLYEEGLIELYSYINITTSLNIYIVLYVYSCTMLFSFRIT